MNPAAYETKYCSREEFRRWCAAQPKGRYERQDGRIVAMAPERGAHLRAKGAVYKALDRAITVAGVPCQALPDGATVETAITSQTPWSTVASRWPTTRSPPPTP